MFLESNSNDRDDDESHEYYQHQHRYERSLCPQFLVFVQLQLEGPCIFSSFSTSAHSVVDWNGFMVSNPHRRGLFPIFNSTNHSNLVYYFYDVHVPSRLSYRIHHRMVQPPPHSHHNVSLTMHLPLRHG